MGKFLQLWVIVAILNPLCCCDAVSGPFLGTEPDMEQHDCCGGGGEKTGEQQDRHHGRDDCPHRVGNGYQQASVEHVKAVDLGTAPLDLPLIAEILRFDTDLEPDYFDVHQIAHDSNRGPPALFRVNCVYLI